VAPIKTAKKIPKADNILQILHGMVEVPITFTPHSSSTRGHSQRFVAPFARTETFLHSFLPSTITLWNSLPNSLVDLDELVKFKDELHSHFFPAR